MLWEVVVSKGKPNGTISKKEFHHYKKWHEGTGIYVCQESAWMDKEVMNLWIQAVLKLYLWNKPHHICLVLLLNSYQCHVMTLIVDKIEALGITVLHILGGCTPLCQPLDLGVCKPLKICVKKLQSGFFYKQLKEKKWMLQIPSHGELAG